MRSEGLPAMYSSTRPDPERQASPGSPTSAGCLPPSVVHVSREELKRFLKCKRVGNYLLGKTIGEGSFAKVKQGFHVLTGEKVAVKIIDKKQALEDRYVSKNMRREARILQMVRHPNVIQLLEVVETENRYYLVFDLAGGGDLMDYICYRKRLGETEVRKFIRQIISAVHYLHQGGIIHRDLKVENLLLDEEYNIRLIDFGLSNTVYVPKVGILGHERSSMRDYCKTQCGSPAYAAPEILGHQLYGPKVDVWSIGVNMYAMLTGKLPYTAEPFNIVTLYNKMVRGDMNPIPERLSSSCRNLLLRFLTFDPTDRISLDEAITHPWLSKGYENEPFTPVTFPNHLRLIYLNTDILEHMSNKMHFTEKEIIDGVTSNKSNSASCVYHLLSKKLQRYLLRHPKQKNSIRVSRRDTRPSRESDGITKKIRIENASGGPSAERIKVSQTDSRDSTDSTDAGDARLRLACDQDGRQLRDSNVNRVDSQDLLNVPMCSAVQKSEAFENEASVNTGDGTEEQGQEATDSVFSDAGVTERKHSYNPTDNELRGIREGLGVPQVTVATSKVMIIPSEVNNNTVDTEIVQTIQVPARSEDAEAERENEALGVDRVESPSGEPVEEFQRARVESGSGLALAPISAKVVSVPLSRPPSPLVLPETVTLASGQRVPSPRSRGRTHSSPAEQIKYDTTPFSISRTKRPSLPCRAYPVTRDPSPIRKPILPSEPGNKSAPGEPGYKPQRRNSNPTVNTYGLVCQVASAEPDVTSREAEISKTGMVLKSTRTPLSVHCSPKPVRRHSTPVNPTKEFYKEIIGFDPGSKGYGKAEKTEIIDSKKNFKSVSLRPRRSSTSSTSSDDSKKLSPRMARLSLPLPITPREPLLPNLELKLHTKHPPIEPLTLPLAPLLARRLEGGSASQGRRRRSRRLSRGEEDNSRSRDRHVRRSTIDNVSRKTIEEVINESQENGDENKSNAKQPVKKNKEPRDKERRRTIAIDTRNISHYTITPSDHTKGSRVRNVSEVYLDVQPRVAHVNSTASSRGSNDRARDDGTSAGVPRFMEVKYSVTDKERRHSVPVNASSGVKQMKDSEEESFINGNKQDVTNKSTDYETKDYNRENFKEVSTDKEEVPVIERNSSETNFQESVTNNEPDVAGGERDISGECDTVEDHERKRKDSSSSSSPPVPPLMTSSKYTVLKFSPRVPRKEYR